jgi:glutamate dehydrogenase (NAD(P)+)
MELVNIKPTAATAILQGFGNVGSVAAAELVQRGVRIVGVSDHTAAYYDAKGLDVGALLEHVRHKKVLRGYSSASLDDPSELMTQRCDILVPAALERIITGENAGQLQCRILAEGANGPTTPEADLILSERGKDFFLIPDILCNSGGVIVSYFEWVQDLQRFFWDESEILDKLYRTLERSLQRVLSRAAADGISNRDAAVALGVETVRNAKSIRGLFP